DARRPRPWGDRRATRWGDGAIPGSRDSAPVDGLSDARPDAARRQDSRGAGAARRLRYARYAQYCRTLSPGLRTRSQSAAQPRGASIRPASQWPRQQTPGGLRARGRLATGEATSQATGFARRPSATGDATARAAPGGRVSAPGGGDGRARGRHDTGDATGATGRPDGARPALRFPARAPRLQHAAEDWPVAVRSGVYHAWADLGGRE